MLKSDLRKQFCNQIQNLESSVERSHLGEQLLKNFKKSIPLSSLSIVGLFAAQKNEIDTFPLIHHLLEKDVQVALPKLSFKSQQTMRFFEIKSLADLEVHAKFQIYEPRSVLDEVPIINISFLCVPAIAFGKNGARLGRGGGYYDALIPKLHNKALILGMAYDLQVNQLLDLPLEAWDVSVPQVMTEKSVYEF